VFLFALEESDILINKIEKVIESYKGAQSFEIKLNADITHEIDGVKMKKENTKGLIKASRSTVRDYLQRHVLKESNEEGGEIGKLEAYRLFINREQAIFKNLNMLKPSKDIVAGLLWCPTEDNFGEKVREYMSSIKTFSFHQVKDTSKLTLKEPTKFYDNGFVDIF
jgi:hypothetical protein